MSTLNSNVDFGGRTPLSTSQLPPSVVIQDDQDVARGDVELGERIDDTAVEAPLVSIDRPANITHDLDQACSGSNDDLSTGSRTGQPDTDQANGVSPQPRRASLTARLTASTMPRFSSLLRLSNISIRASATPRP